MAAAFPSPAIFKRSARSTIWPAFATSCAWARTHETDVRVNKSWTHDKWKLTLYGEVINLTNRTNYVFDSFDGYTTSTKQAYITLDKLFPILPSAGLVFER